MDDRPDSCHVHGELCRLAGSELQLFPRRDLEGLFHLCGFILKSDLHTELPAADKLPGKTGEIGSEFTLVACGH